MYEREAAKLKVALAPLSVGIDHIGSTAVIDLEAKPVVDILLQADSLRAIDDQTRQFEQMGYQARGEYGVAGRRYFSKKLSLEVVSGFHIHAFKKGARPAMRHLAFRDCLRSRSDLVSAYSSLKRSIADKHGRLPTDYLDQKASFVDLIADIALFESNAAVSCNLIPMYRNPASLKHEFDMSYHRKWINSLEKQILTLEVKNF